jgi:hypothetical protein
VHTTVALALTAHRCACLMLLRLLIRNVQLNVGTLILLLLILGECVGNLFIRRFHISKLSEVLFGNHSEQSFDSLESTQSQ